MGQILKQYPLSAAIVVFSVTVILLGAPLIGLVLLLIGGYLVHRSHSTTVSIPGAFLKWLDRNRYLLAASIIVSLLSGLVPASSSLQAKVYGFPVGFLVYYPKTDVLVDSTPTLSSIAVRVSEFFLNVACYYVFVWVLARIRYRAVHTV